MIPAALLAALLLLPAPTSLVPPTPCSGVNHVAWPVAHPIWDFCWKRPGETTYVGNGAGLEISNVRYNGTLVISQAHLPILNVKYSPNVTGCGGPNLCYRDWTWQEQQFECSPSPADGYCTATETPTSTVCNHPGSDAGDFAGVAVEDLGTSLRLTSQSQAGWYRYIPVWEFFPDGTIYARFVATSIDFTCVSYTHEHHAYFRLDFDVNGGAGNVVDRVLPGNLLERVTTERNFIDTSPVRSKWRISSAGSPYVVEVSRNSGDGGAGDPPVVPNDFPVADGWVLAYNPNEIADYQNTDICAANLNSFVNNQNVDGADVVLWVHAEALHEGEAGGVARDCSTVGPTIRVLPATPPPGTKLTTVTPCRIADTRNAAGPYGGPALPAGGTRNFTIPGRCGIPGTAKSVAVNLTAVQASSGGYLTAFPAGGSIPLASTVNFAAGQTRANNVTLTLGSGGAVSILNASPGPVNFLLDVTGYFE